jgi:2-dehydropantoate 2-reductase
MNPLPALRAPHTVAVLGAGAVGGYFGAVLARAGVDVTLIARPVQVEAIARDGLHVRTAGGDWSVRVRAAADAAAARGADVVLLAVKTPDTAAAAHLLAPHLRPDARVVSLQNGVDNAARIAAVLPNPVFAAVVYVGCDVEGPGRLRHTGRGDLVLGVTRALAARTHPGDLATLAALFAGAGVACPLSPDIEAALWSKLTLNCAFNAVSALGDAHYGRMAANAAIRGVMEAAIHECIAVARAEGVALDAQAMIGAAWELAAAMAGQFSSTAQDVRRGRRTEIDALNGVVAERGAACGIATPVNRTLHALVKLRETRA